MTIFARELAVRSYRSYETYDLALADGVTVLVGRNAVGKTNLIEALQLLTTGRSFRRPSPAELVRAGCDRCRLELTLEGEGRVIDMALEVSDGKRSFRRNGKRCAASGVRGVLPSVLFCPDDLDMVKRSARVRRDALDAFGMQLNERYAELVGAYERIVEQRNSLLRERACSPDLMAAWDDALVTTGAALMDHRMALLERIRVHLVRAYGSIAPHEQADVAYVPSANRDGAADAPLPADRGALREQLEDQFRRRLEELRNEEWRRGMTLVGPHRDEVAFSIDGRPARTYASQGQQRSLVLAWKVAEVEVTRDILSRPPLLLLDDVMSELDAHRRDAFLGSIEGEVQTVITTTNLGYFTPDVLERARVIEIGGAEDARAPASVAEPVGKGGCT